MDKIAFVIVRYGKEINGGAELHCRMLAERLKNKYQVEVLTTCVRNYLTEGSSFHEGIESIDGVLVRRFKTQRFPLKRHRYRHRAQRNEYVRMFLFKLHLLSLFDKLFSFQKIARQSALNMMKDNVFYSPDLFNFIKGHKQDYKVFIPITLEYPTTFYTALYAPERTIIIPTLHLTRTSFSPLHIDVMTKVAYVAFNTYSEEKLGEKIFGDHLAPHGIVSTGFELQKPGEWTEIQRKFNLPDTYLLYAGRIDEGKLTHLYEYFTAYKMKYPESDLKLVLMGAMYSKSYSHPDILYTNFVSDSEKTAIIQHAEIVVNPSLYESLSLILLEALYEKRPMLVNGRCTVLEEHAHNSNGAVCAYYNKAGFIKILHQLHSNPFLRKKMGEEGKKYVEKNYSWETIIKRLTTCIDSIQA